MVTKNEVISIVIATIILGLTISLIKSLEIFLIAIVSIFLIVLINIFAKKIMSFYLDSEIEVKIWEIKRYGFRPQSQFNKPIPVGAFFPIILTAISFGYITWMAPLSFDVKPKIYRTAKRHGLYSFSEMTEYHLGLIAASGIFVSLIFSFIGYLLNFPEFARLSILYAFFNMIPISDLDGNKIFFGSIILWSFLAAITLIALGYVILLV